MKMDAGNKLREERSLLKQRIEQLEKDLADRDKRLLKAREEVALAKEEVSQKTKFVVQLQKQLVELENASKVSQTGSGLFGALLGAASGETHALSRLKQDHAVQQEELMKQIENNEKLQTMIYELEQQAERDKKELTMIVDTETRRAIKSEKEMIKLKEAMDAMTTHKEILAKELAESEKRNFTMQRDLTHAKTRLLVLERKRDREIEQQIIMGAYPIALKMSGSAPWIVKEAQARCEVLLTLGDLQYWLMHWQQSTMFGSEQLGNASRALVDTFQKLKQELEVAEMSAFFVLNSEYMDTLIKASRTLGGTGGISFARSFVVEHDRFVKESNESSTSSRFWQLVLNGMVAFLSTVSSPARTIEVSLEPLISKALIDLNTAAKTLESVRAEAPSSLQEHKEQVVQEWRELIGLPRSALRLTEEPPSPAVDVDRSTRVEDSMKHSTEREIDITKQSDESFLNSLEDFLMPKKETTLPVSSRPSGLRKESTAPPPLIEEDHTLISLSPVPATSPPHTTIITPSEDLLQLKKQFHQDSLGHLKQIAALKDLVTKAEERATEAEEKLESFQKQKLGHLQTQERSQEAMQKLKEDLEETRLSYNSQLMTLTERIMELEQDLQLKSDEVNQLKAERVLMTQLKKTIGKRTPT